MKFWLPIDIVLCMNTVLLNINENVLFPSKFVFPYIFVLADFFPIQVKLLAFLPHQVFPNSESSNFGFSVFKLNGYNSSSRK